MKTVRPDSRSVVSCRTVKKFCFTVLLCLNFFSITIMDTAGPFRVRLTAIERRRRRGESSSTIIPQTEDDLQIEEGEGDEESEELTTLFSGGRSGLTDITFLWSFKNHISVHI